MSEVTAGIPAALIGGPVVAICHRDEGHRFDVTIGMPVTAAPMPRVRP